MCPFLAAVVGGRVNIKDVGIEKISLDGQNLSKMAQSRVFTLIGDSNLRRHLNSTNCRDRPMMSGAQHLTCGRLEVLSESLTAMKKESNVLIVACITNFLTSSSDVNSSVSLRVEPVFQDFLRKVLDHSTARPDIKILVCPPMYRRQPIWYREGLPEVLTKFSSVLSPCDMIHLMPSFPTPSFEADGIHLTPYSGLEYVLHLFDSAISALDALDLPLEVTCKRSAEISRALEDRVMVLEQDHLRLNTAMELKSAVDAELADYHQNVAFESFITIQGMKRAPQGLDPREWQVQSKAEVKAFLCKLMGKDVPVVFVKNSTSRRPGAETRYHVQLQSVAESKAIRDTFSAFFEGGKNTLPPEFKGLALRNRLTQETRIRLAIMQLLAHRYRESNPDGKAKVIGFESRPLLKITPPASSDGAESRVQSYTYIDAVKKFPTNFSSEELKPILSMIGAEQKGKVRSLFLVINDDMLKRSRPGGRDGDVAPGASSGPDPDVTRDRSGSGSGLEASGRSKSTKRGHSVSPAEKEDSRKKNKGRK